MDEMLLNIEELAKIAHEAEKILHNNELTEPFKKGYINAFMTLLCYNLDIMAMQEHADNEGWN